MKKGYKKMLWFCLGVIVMAVCFFVLYAQIGVVRSSKRECLTGAFLADTPGKADILSFQETYGKKPYYVLMFTDWGNYPSGEAIKGILEESCCPIVTWEPWKAHAQEAIDLAGLMRGEYDDYIREFAARMGSFDGEILLRFAHEMNGNWYPWSGSNIGADKYKDMYRYVKDIFDETGIQNVKWVFSINWEDVPRTAANEMLNYYPGADYVDYVGLDGYNWGTTREWSSWTSFDELFGGIYKKTLREFGKPVIISEFSSVSEGGDKTEWIQQAMRKLKTWDKVQGFVLFDVDKEVDWTFPITKSWGRKFRDELSDPCFVDKEEDDR